MKNPWENLSANQHKRYVLSEDEPYIRSYNTLPQKDKHRINLWIPPEPRLGPINAPVFILQLNPSCAHKDEKPEDFVRLDKDLASIKNEDHVHLGAAIENAPWWAPRLNELRQEMEKGDCAHKLEERICSVEFFPYRSKEFNHGHLRLPSQAYTFSLVRAAIERRHANTREPRTLFIVTRNFGLWAAAVPELVPLSRTVPKTVFFLNNRRSSYFTKNNMEPGDFQRIVTALRGE